MMCKLTGMLTVVLMFSLVALAIVGVIFLYKLIINNNKYKK